MALNLSDVNSRRRLYIALALKRVRPGSGSSLETLRARTWRQTVFNLSSIITVPFVVVGGVATRLYAPERMTDDLDVLILTEDGAVLSATGGGGGKANREPLGRRQRMASARRYDAGRAGVGCPVGA